MQYTHAQRAPAQKACVWCALLVLADEGVHFMRVHIRLHRNRIQQLLCNFPILHFFNTH